MFSGEENVKITKEEFKMIEKSMKDKRFHGLLDEYMQEISDPKNVIEQNQYYEQLKREGEIPKEISFIKPNEGFVIKSTLGSNTDRKFSQKIYINVCSSDKVKMSEGKANKNEGMNWSCPYFLSKSRYNQDNNKEVVSVIDIVFHIQTLELCNYYLPFKNMISETSIDAVSKLIKEKNEIINKDYEFIKDIKYKGDISLLPINLSGKNIDRKEDKPKSYYDMMSEKEKQNKNKEKETNNEVIKEEDEDVDHEEIKQEQIEKYEGSQITPKYDILYSYPIDYLDCLNNKEKPNLNIPNNIKIKIKLPLVKNSKKLKIDLSKKVLVLEYFEKIKDKEEIIYFLNINFNYQIDKNKSKAKYEKDKNLLILECPIILKKFKKDNIIPDKPEEDISENVNKPKEENKVEKNQKPKEENKVEENQKPKEENTIEENQKPKEEKTKEENQKPKDENKVEENQKPKEENTIEESQKPKEENTIEESQKPKEENKIEENQKPKEENKVEENQKPKEENKVEENNTSEIVKTEEKINQNNIKNDTPEENNYSKNNEVINDLLCLEEFNKQEISNNLFITIYIKNYNKDNLKYFYVNQELLIVHESQYYYIKFQDNIEVEFKFVIDYISLIVKISENQSKLYDSKKINNFKELDDLISFFEKESKLIEKNIIDNDNNQSKHIKDQDKNLNDKENINQDNVEKIPKIEINNDNKKEIKKEKSINQVMFPVLKTSKYINKLI